jgi:hypothetical protein
MLESPRVRRVTGLLLAFVGPYSNLEVTSAVLQEAGRREISPCSILVRKTGGLSGSSR